MQSIMPLEQTNFHISSSKTFLTILRKLEMCNLCGNHDISVRGTPNTVNLLNIVISGYLILLNLVLLLYLVKIQ